MTLRLWIAKTLARVEAGTSGYLASVGWIDSRASGASRDQDGNPIPWFTYPAIRFLAERVQPEWRVLEFGAGLGTCWWSARVAEVVALEHSEEWARQVAQMCAARLLKTDDESAERYVAPARGTGPYDVVIVDGQFRNECLVAATELVGATGVIVLDDAWRAEYAPGIAHVRSRGFRMLSFHGPQPVGKHEGCTTIFYRDANVCGI